MKCPIGGKGSHLVNGLKVVECVECNFMFCSQCVLEYLYNNKDSPCPRCKCAPFKVTTEIHGEVVSILQNTMVKCDVGGCKNQDRTSFRLDDYGKHASLNHLVCPNECDRELYFTPATLSNHMQNDCIFSIRTCK
jgi:hypothetical protein